MFVPQVRSKLEILHDHGFPAYAFATMARYYGTHLKTIQDTVPPHKLLLVETETLAYDATS